MSPRSDTEATASSWVRTDENNSSVNVPQPSLSHRTKYCLNGPNVDNTSEVDDETQRQRSTATWDDIDLHPNTTTIGVQYSQDGRTPPTTMRQGLWITPMSSQFRGSDQHGNDATNRNPMDDASPSHRRFDSTLSDSQEQHNEGTTSASSWISTVLHLPNPSPVDTTYISPWASAAEPTAFGTPSSGNFGSLLVAVEHMIEGEVWESIVGGSTVVPTTANSSSCHPVHSPIVSSRSRNSNKRTSKQAGEEVQCDPRVVKTPRVRTDRSTNRSRPQVSLVHNTKSMDNHNNLQGNTVTAARIPPHDSILIQNSTAANKGTKYKEITTATVADPRLDSTTQPLRPKAAALMAAQAAKMASEILSKYPDKAKQLWVHVVLSRWKESEKTHEMEEHMVTSSIPLGFVWSRYPPLEHVLQKHAKRYYEISHNHNQSKIQREFNQHLVTFIRRTAASVFSNAQCLEQHSDKQLCTRIRCYYKTHLQNAKKRLHTMIHSHSQKSYSQQQLIQILPTLEALLASGITKNGSSLVRSGTTSNTRAKSMTSNTASNLLSNSGRRSRSRGV